MNPSRLLQLGNYGMLTSFVMSGVAVALGYFFYSGLSLIVQVMAHLMLLVFPAIFKICYLVRLTALNQLGLPVD